MIVNITVNTDERFQVLGTVVMPEEMSETAAQKLLQGMWNRWRKRVPHPDSDSQFMQWLVDNDFVRIDGHKIKHIMLKG